VVPALNMAPVKSLRGALMQKNSIRKKLLPGGLWRRKISFLL